MPTLLSERVWKDAYARDLHFGGTLLHEAMLEQEESPAYSDAGPPR